MAVGKTAGELLRELENNPEYVAMRQRKDAELAQRVAVLARASAPLIAALAGVGVDVASVWDLVNRPNDYDVALPVLLTHLNLEYPEVIREGIARALGVPNARPLAWEAVVSQYKREPMRQVKSGLAVAISAMADRSVLDEVIALVRDRANGPSRILLLSVLSRSRDPAAATTLTELADDPDLYKEIAIILKRKAKRLR